ncbi:anthranilate synthase component I [Actinomyces graevenitzii F0530]|uniref:anthranilate synthase n=1 Tax=Actinomyces graevenitzii F0530 TaxID=1321817 RepID=U1PF86_9ACTO|nr:anthranilate synthase component 1 [Actinomyces graevenitzii]ERH15240.1 anthranilate synthase component I [Actinomyces graevenitzii F0530]
MANTPTVFTRPVKYHADGGALLAHLAQLGLVDTVQDGSRPTNTVLLESADIASKQHLTTIAVLAASAQITCTGDTVTLKALDTTDGPQALKAVAQYLSSAVTRQSDSELVLHLPSVAEDSAEEHARLRERSTMEPLRILTDQVVAHPHLPLVAGAVAFDYLGTYESLPSVADGANTCPDYLFFNARIILVVDHPSGSCQLVGASLDAAQLSAQMDALEAAINELPAQAPSAPAEQAAPAQQTTPAASAHQQAASPETQATPAPSAQQAAEDTITAYPTISDTDFCELVAKMQQHIAIGDAYQVVPSRGFVIDCPQPLQTYRYLHDADPSPYMFYIATDDFELFGASPESSLLHSAKTGQVAIRPIAGTRPRGFAPDDSIDHELDIRLELELRSDAKEVAEHVMLVDLARNDVARISAPGTRKVTQLLRVDRYSRVMHLVSEVTGQLASDLHPLDAFRASMTMGTLTGAPKLRAAELIRQYEGTRRGSYGGAVGYLRGDGELDTCIVIRSAFARGGKAIVQAGAGVVSDSVPQREADETAHKASNVLRAIAAAQGKTLRIERKLVSKEA